MALRRTPDSRPLEPTADDPELEDVSATVKLTLRPPFMQVAGAEAASISDLMDTHITQILGQLLSPARDRYDSVDLGPSSFRFRGLPVVRRDFRVTNDRDMVLAASVWLVQRGDGARGGPSCVYVHDIGCSRRQALGVLGVCFDAGLRAVCAFDTSACGRSPGRSVSLGWYERLDVACVLNALAAPPFELGPFVVWGRGLGAIAAAFCADEEATARLLGARNTSAAAARTARAVARPCSVRLFAHASPPRSDEPRGAVAMRTRLKAHGLTYAAAAAEPMTKDESAPLFSSFTSSSLFGGSKQQVRITSVAPGSGAARAGVRAGDVVLGVGSSPHTPTTEGEFVEALARAFDDAVTAHGAPKRRASNSARPRPSEPTARFHGVVVHFARRGVSNSVAKPGAASNHGRVRALILDSAPASAQALFEAARGAALAQGALPPPPPPRATNARVSLSTAMPPAPSRRCDLAASDRHAVLAYRVDDALGDVAVRSF